MVPTVTAPAYPDDLPKHVFWNCRLDEYGTKLDSESQRLLEQDRNAEVNFIVLKSPTDGFEEDVVDTDQNMTNIVNRYVDSNASPRCQYAFIHASSSLKRLKITKSMLQTLFLHDMVMPSYLDLMFTFGKQPYKKNFDFSGFRSKEIFESPQIGANTANLRSPTYKFQMCYNLRCIEPAVDPPEWPWSIRQTAIFHSFDVNSGDSSWIITKGSRDMFETFQRVTCRGAPSGPALFSSRQGAFRATLGAHLVFCEWSSGNWADYIGFLEERLHTKTRYALLATVEKPKKDIPRSRH